MLKLLAAGTALALGLLAGCQSSPPSNPSAASPPSNPTNPSLADAPALEDTPGQPAPSGPAAPGAPTAAAARAAVGHYIQPLREAALYALYAARVNDNGATWQVLVPRTDWEGRMPNSARFEVDKKTGQVSTAPVK